jgi:hypothetical protein
MWHVFNDYKVPYVVVLGMKGNFTIHISHENTEKTLIDDIPIDIVNKLIEQLSQTDRLRVARAAQILLKPEQSSFRLKQISEEIYQNLIKDFIRFPTTHRFFIGKDTNENITRILQLIYFYSTSTDRQALLIKLSGEIDLLKMFLQQIFKLKLIDGIKFGQRMALIIEMGNLVGGLLRLNSKKT